MGVIGRGRKWPTTAGAPPPYPAHAVARAGGRGGRKVWGRGTGTKTVGLNSARSHEPRCPGDNKAQSVGDVGVRRAHVARMPFDQHHIRSGLVGRAEHRHRPSTHGRAGALGSAGFH